MADKISLQPKILDLSLYAGDGADFKLSCIDSAEAPVDVSGATEAQIRLDRLVDDAPIVEFATDMTNAEEGIILISLTGEQTKQLVDHSSSKQGKFLGVWDLQWTADGSEPRTLCQGKVECLADVTR